MTCNTPTPIATTAKTITKVWVFLFDASICRIIRAIWIWFRVMPLIMYRSRTASFLMKTWHIATTNLCRSSSELFSNPCSLRAASSSSMTGSGSYSLIFFLPNEIAQTPPDSGTKNHG